MDELTRYLKSDYYRENEIENILNKKIIITKDHIDNIKSIHCCDRRVNIIKLFEKYGYVFTDDDYIMLVKKGGRILRYIPENKRTNKICEIAVQQDGSALQYVPEDKKTNKICEIAVQQDGTVLEYVPEDMKTDEICKTAIKRYNKTLQFIPNNKKTNELCKIRNQFWW